MTSRSQGFHTCVLLAVLFAVALAATHRHQRTVSGEQLAKIMIDEEDRDLMLRHNKRHFSEHDAEMLRSINEEFDLDGEDATTLFQQLDTLLNYEAHKHEDALDGDEEIDADNMDFDPHTDPAHGHDVFGKPVDMPGLRETYEVYGAVLDPTVRYIDQIEKISRYGLPQVADVLFDQAMRRMSQRAIGFVSASTDIIVEQGMGGLQIVDRVETQRYEAGTAGHADQWTSIIRDTFRIHVRREILEQNLKPGQTSHPAANYGTGRPLIAIIERIASVHQPISIASQHGFQ